VRIFEWFINSVGIRVNNAEKEYRAKGIWNRRLQKNAIGESGGGIRP
jgi:hypothetical protein